MSWRLSERLHASKMYIGYWWTFPFSVDAIDTISIVWAYCRILFLSNLSLPDSDSIARCKINH